MDSQPMRVLLSLIELPIALGVAFATFVAFSMAGCKWAHCVDVSGLPWYLGGALLGIVVAGIYWWKSMRSGDRFKRRLVVDAVAIMIGVAAVVVPQIDGWRAQADAERARSSLPARSTTSDRLAPPPQIAR